MNSPGSVSSQSRPLFAPSAVPQTKVSVRDANCEKHTHVPTRTHERAVLWVAPTGSDPRGCCYTAVEHGVSAQKRRTVPSMPLRFRDWSGANLPGEGRRSRRAHTLDTSTLAVVLSVAHGTHSRLSGDDSTALLLGLLGGHSPRVSAVPHQLLECALSPHAPRSSFVAFSAFAQCHSVSLVLRRTVFM